MLLVSGPASSLQTKHGSLLQSNSEIVTSAAGEKGPSPYFGAVIGRVANRIANASFVLDGQRHNISANENGNTLHGGKSGWSVKTWNMSEIYNPHGEAVKLTYTSPDGDEVWSLLCVRRNMHQ